MIGADTHQGLNYCTPWAETVFGGAEMVFIGVDIDQIDKMAPQGLKSAPGALQLNRHFGAETDLLNLQCSVWRRDSGKQDR